MNLTNLNGGKWPERVVRSKYDLQEYQKNSARDDRWGTGEGEQPGAAGLSGNSKEFIRMGAVQRGSPLPEASNGQAAEGLQNLGFFPSSGQPVVSELYEGKG